MLQFSLRSFTKYILLIILILFSSQVKSQVPIFNWASAQGGAYLDQCKYISVDDSGNVYTTGIFAGTADFDPSPTSTYYLTAVNYDIYISKLDAAGNFKWARKLGGSAYDIPTGIALDDSGNVYTTGSYSGTADFNPSITDTFNLYNGGMFISKLTASGYFVWAKGISYNSGNAAYCYGLAIDESANIYLTGSFVGSLDFNTNPQDTYYLTNNSGHATFILKMSSVGNFIWVTRVQGISIALTINIDPLGNIITAGKFHNSSTDSTDFDPSATNAYYLRSFGGETIFILKLDSSGNFIWVKKMGGTKDNIVTSITTDRNGNIFSTGYFAGVSDFDPGNNVFNLTSNTTFTDDIFISKLNASGNFVWAKMIGGVNDDSGNSIATDTAGKVYITGFFNATVDLNPGTGTQINTSVGGKEIFIEKLDNAGNFIWAKAIGSYGDDIGTGIILDKEGYIYTAGNFNATVDFDINQPVFNLAANSGIDDIYILRIKQCLPTVSNYYYTACDSFKINGYSYYSSGLFKQTFTNVSGCDSTFNIYLNIKQSSTHAITTSSCDSFILNNITYKSTGVYTQVLANSKGCDSIITLNLAIKNSTSSMLNITACDSYTILNKTYTLTGVFNIKITNYAGCDSIILLNLTIRKRTTNSITRTACDSIVINNIIYKTSGVFSQTLVNNIGCDSIIILYLSINKITQNNISITACNSYFFNAQTYTVSGVYPFYFTNSIGCDSVVILNLKINKSSLYIINADACKFYKLNTDTYTTTGVHTQLLLNKAGCDSIITLNLTITGPNTGITKSGSVLTANETGAIYQWYNCNNFVPISGATNRSFTPVQTGNYAVVITKNVCADTSVCISANGNGININPVSQKITIYPNPVNAQLNLLSEETLQNATLKLFNIQGELIIEEKDFTGNIFNKNIETICSGIYFIEVNGKGINYRFKVVKL